MEIKNYSYALQIFEHVVTFHDSNSSMSNLLRHLSVKNEIEVKAAYRNDVMTARMQWVEDVIAEKKLLVDANIPCSANYWYSRALATSSVSSIPVMYNVELRTRIYRHLKLLFSCSENDSFRRDVNDIVTEKMLDYARNQLQEIDFMVEFASGELEDP